MLSNNQLPDLRFTKGLQQEFILKYMLEDCLIRLGLFSIPVICVL